MRSGILSLVALSAVIMLVTLSIAGTGGSAPVATAAGSTAALFFDEPHASLTTEELQELAQRSALAFGVSTKQLPIMRAANPSMKLLLYNHPAGIPKGAPDYPFIDAHETWFVHDSKGSRMHEANGGDSWAWLLNINTDGYRAFEEQRVVDLVFQNPYDGYFLDTSNPYWPIFRDWYDVNDQPTTPTNDVLQNWPDWMLSFQRELRAMTGTKTHIFNSWPNNVGRYNDYKYWLEATLAAVNGVQFDGFCYNRSQPWSTSSWQYQVTSAQRILGMGKIAMLKSPMDNLQQDLGKLHQLQRFCFGSYLLVADGKNAYFRNPDEADVVYWNERLFTAPIGQPTGAYYTVGDLYRRDFTNGTVIVNPTTADKKIDLGMAYYRLKGTTDRIVTIKALSGLILLTTAPPP